MEQYDMCYEKEIDGKLRILPDAPFRFQEFDDTIKHICSDGETLWEIAAKYYHKRGLPRASMWYMWIANFQPEPIVDPTLKMKGGKVLYIPSPRVIRNYAQDSARDPEFQNW